MPYKRVVLQFSPNSVGCTLFWRKQKQKKKKLKSSLGGGLFSINYFSIALYVRTLVFIKTKRGWWKALCYIVPSSNNVVCWLLCCYFVLLEPKHTSKNKTKRIEFHFLLLAAAVPLPCCCRHASVE